MFSGGMILQLVVVGGLLNVWVLRKSKGTAYRGGDSQTLMQEFKTYGLSEKIFYLVGFLKISAAMGLIAAFWMPALTLYSASVIAVLMVGALMMHFKVKDPIKKSLPALAMLVMSLSLVFISLNSGR